MGRSNGSTFALPNPLALDKLAGLRDGAFGIAL
jgi:hypothetical protein